MARTKRIIAASAAAAALMAASGAALPPPALAAGAASVGSVFSGTIEAASQDGILVERKQKSGASALIAVDTDRDTVVSRGGQQLPFAALSLGSEVIVSGTKTPDGAILATKIIVR
jgi:hypothetical protein